MHRSGRRAWVFGHRGASARAPENTMRSFAMALDEGADGVELDVRLAGCGTVVVAHDPDLSRVAGAPAVVARHTVQELAAFDVGGGERIPTLDDVIDLVRGRDGRINIELKGDVPSRLATCRALAKLLARRSSPDRAGLFLSSFRPEMLTAMRALGAGLPVGFLFDRENTGMVRAALLRRALRPDGEHPHHPLATEEAIARWHARGQFVHAWTVNDPAAARRLDANGVDALITNDPRGILEALSPQ
jgi:glycerophosphoryl diester phosphodiesterase